MHALTSNEVVAVLLSCGTLLAAARIFGELARKLNQPPILGEIIAGILLGPTLLGAVAPGVFHFIFPREGAAPLVLEGITKLAIVSFMLVAGMEVDLSTIWRQGKSAFMVSVSGMVVPFAIGLIVGTKLPDLFGRPEGANPDVFGLFLATAMAISALPVIARTLMDLNLYRSDLGMLIVAAAICNDLAGWIIFAVLLGMMDNTGGSTFAVTHTILLTLGFAIGMLTLGRWLIDRALPWIQAHTIWPGGVLSFAMFLAIFGGAFTQWIGVHAVFGAFLVGVAIGDSEHLREKTRTTINDFVASILAPMFFASIGLTLDFVANFDPLLCLLVFVLACLGKVIGCGVGARWSGMPPREAWAVGFGMNARGAMEIILGLLALQAGVIGERLFVGLVVMALLTSLMSGPFIQRILRLRKTRRMMACVSTTTFIRELQAKDSDGAIAELCGVASQAGRLSPDLVTSAVLARERMMSTGMGDGLAVPHARLSDVTAPIVAVGLSRAGIDFNSPDGELTHFVFLILTSQQDDGSQVEILADIARSFQKEPIRSRAMEVKNYTEFRALLRTEAD